MTSVLEFAKIGAMRKSVSLSFALLGLSAFWISGAQAERDDADGADSTWTPISPSERVVAAAWGRETALLRDVTLLTFEETEANPGFTSSLLVGRDGNKIPVQTVRVTKGRVDAVLVPSDQERGVLLAGPDSVSAIANRGRISMSVTKDEVFVQALREEALAGHRGIFKKLSPGVVRVFNRASGKYQDEAPAPAPEFRSTSALSVAMTGGAELGLVAEGSGDVCFGLRDEDGTNVGSTACGPAGTAVKVAAPGAGIFHAVARRLGDGNLDGALSKPVTLRVLGLAEGQVPPESGVFLLERFERIRLLGTAGLEMRVGSSKLFVPATESIGLAQGQPTIVEFRSPDAPEQRTQLRLSPKIGKVETSIGPAGVKWPGNPARVSVAVHDGNGKLMDEDDGLELSVSVNSEIVPADFRKTKNGLVADVPAQAGSGPWVIRLHVYDEDDRELARDFLEVVRRN